MRRRRGDETKAAEYTTAAEAFANQLIAKETEIENLKTMSLQSTQAADQAKAAVNQNSRLLQEKLAEKQKLLTQLDQAKMAEQMNTAMSSLTETVGDDVPTLDEVRDKIETRYAKAKGMSEIQGMSVETKMLEVEQASVNFEAQARLSEIRSKLGIGDAAAARDRRRATEPLRTATDSEPASRHRVTRRADARVRGSMTRSSRWTTSPAPSDSSEDRRPAIVRSSAASPGEALGDDPPERSAISTASSDANAPWTPTTPAASSDRPPAVSARDGAVVDQDRPRAGRAKAIQSLRAGSRRSRGDDHGAHPGQAVDGVEQHVGARCVGDDGSDTRP